MDPIALASASGFVETHALGSSVHTPTARRPPRSSWNPLPALPRLDDEVDADKIVLAASFHSLWLPSAYEVEHVYVTGTGSSQPPPLHDDLLPNLPLSSCHLLTVVLLFGRMDVLMLSSLGGQETLKSPQQSNDAFLFTVRSMTSLPHRDLDRSDLTQKKEILEWFQTLKFPDGYGSNLRRGVNFKKMRINGSKSHDYHIMMECLLPVMFRGYFQPYLWEVIAELSFFYRKLCAKEVDPIDLESMELQVPVLLLYTVHNPVARYNVIVESRECSLSLFSIKGDSISRGVTRHLTEVEWEAAMLYVLTNLPEVDDYIGKFLHEEWSRRGKPTRQQKENLLRNGARNGRPNFVTWFYQQSLIDMNINDDLKQVAKGCHTRVKTYSIYDVNGYRFRTDKYEKERPNATTINSGLVTIGQGENSDITDYYGYIKEIIELSFHVYEPFAVAHQATQVYYIPYPCKSVPALIDWWVVYKVQPTGKIAAPVDKDYDFLPNNDTVHYFQEDGLQGTFVVDLMEGLHNVSEATSRDAEGIVNDKDLQLLNGSNVLQQDESDSSDSDEDEEEGPIIDEYY
uniref:Transposon protein, putative, CACTA, En/Spm sub-class n=1 Tax=Oryza sativa subsp. japonica TaxID=39947 RepID=Q2QNW4_ORYSJ|nr:transposon protein, putative, CACTA, En/Spm sub-class [Oryza sativa Japonica Group]